MVKTSKEFQNRAQRRLNSKSFRKTSKIDRSNWGEWEEKSNTFSQNSKRFIEDKKLLKGMKCFYVNNFVSVQVCPVQTDWGKVQRLGIRRHDEKPNLTWKEKQRIKNELFGDELIALEVFPKQSELIDQANMIWLWVLPADFDLPLSINI